MKLSTIYQSLASVIMVGFILWFGKPFLIPLAYAFLIALVLYPMCRFFEKKGFGKALSITIPIILLSVLFGGLVSILSYELFVLSQKWTSIHQQLDPLIDSLQKQFEQEFGWTTQQQSVWINDSLNSLSHNIVSYLNSTIDTLLDALITLIIIPIYIALILYFRGHLVRFLVDISPKSFQHKILEVLKEIIAVFSKFIRGMATVYLLVGILNSLGLWILGVKSPILYGMLTAVMTIIPYFGIMISALLPIILTWLETGSIWQPLGIVGVFALVQYLEANLIFPYVVGRFVNLNTFASILIIFLGALIWGIAGMILFLPFFAVFRLFAEHFPELKPWSRLLGNG